MKFAMRLGFTLAMTWLCGGLAEVRADSPAIPVGVAVTDITPGYPVRLSGYESRKTESEGVASPLKAKGLAIGAARETAVLLTVDNCAVPAKVVDEVASRLERRVGLPRARFTVSSSHTHAAPTLANGIPFIIGGPPPEDQKGRIDRYTSELTDALEKVALAAIADQKPGHLAWAQGKAGFAANRRVLKDGRWVNFGVTPDGAVDRSLPVLRVTDDAGKLRALLFGYACHCTTLGGDFNKISADWAGYACDGIEQANPGVTALCVIGCGADANPQPRGKLEDAKAHGSEIAREVQRLLQGVFTEVPGTIEARFERIALPLGEPRTHAQLVEMAKRPGAEGYFARVMLENEGRGESPARTVPYPVQTWSFGDALAIVFLGGEVVADYSLRIKRESRPDRLWVVAYSNDVPCYIASKRMLPEGGYEVDGSMIYYGRPSRLAPEAEDTILRAVFDILPSRFR